MTRISMATREAMLDDISRAARHLRLGWLAVNGDVDGEHGPAVLFRLNAAEEAIRLAMARLPLEVLSPE